MCVGIFQAFDVRVNARSSTKAGPIDDNSDFAPFAASSANTRESMEVELATKWSHQGFFFAARVLEKLSQLKALQKRERDSERTREKTHAFSRMSTSATQCAVTLQGKRPLQKGTNVYQEQENF